MNENAEFKTVRGYQLANQKKGRMTPALEDYLEMAYRLCLENDYARVGQLSELLHVKPSSVSKMISKLAMLGYVKYDRYEIIQLSDSGREIGAYLLMRHKTVETFFKLIDSLNPLEETEWVEHAIAPSTVSALNILNEFFAGNTEVLQKYLKFKEEKQKEELDS